MSRLYRFAPLLVCVIPSASVRADDLAAEAYAQLGSHRFYHGPGPVDAAFSPDGKRIASIAHYPHYPYGSHVSDKEREAYESTIVLWDAATGQRIRELRAPKSPVRYLAFSSDGKRLATTCNGIILIFDIAGGKPP